MLFTFFSQIRYNKKCVSTGTVVGENQGGLTQEDAD